MTVNLDAVVSALIPSAVGSLVSWFAYLHIRAAKLEIKSEVEAGMGSIRSQMATKEDIQRLERRMERVEGPFFGGKK